MNWLYWDRGDYVRIQKKSLTFNILAFKNVTDACYPVKSDPSANFPPVAKCPSRLGCEECPTGVRCVTSRVATSSKFHLKGDTETPLLRCVRASSEEEVAKW